MAARLSIMGAEQLAPKKPVSSSSSSSSSSD
jgi:hypothetical protein